MNSLPKSEVDRIERAAQDYGEKSYDLFSTTLNACQVCYFAGAKAEAIAARDRMIELLQWLTRGDSPFAILYGEAPERFAAIDTDLTSEQVVDAFLSSQTETL